MAPLNPWPPLGSFWPYRTVWAFCLPPGMKRGIDTRRIDTAVRCKSNQISCNASFTHLSRASRAGRYVPALCQAPNCGRSACVLQSPLPQTPPQTAGLASARRPDRSGPDPSPPPPHHTYTRLCVYPTYTRSRPLYTTCCRWWSVHNCSLPSHACGAFPSPLCSRPRRQLMGGSTLPARAARQCRHPASCPPANWGSRKPRNLTARPSAPPTSHRAPYPCASPATGHVWGGSASG